MTKLKFKLEFENVNRYAHSETEIYMSGDRDFRVVRNEELIFETDIDDTIQAIESSSNYCLLPYSESYRTAIYSKKEKSYVIVKDIIGLKFDQNDSLFYGNMESGLCKYDMQNDKQIWKLDQRIFNFFQNNQSFFGTTRRDKTKLFSFF